MISNVFIRHGEYQEITPFAGNEQIALRDAFEAKSALFRDSNTGEHFRINAGLDSMQLEPAVVESISDRKADGLRAITLSKPIRDVSSSQ